MRGTALLRSLPVMMLVIGCAVGSASAAGIYDGVWSVQLSNMNGTLESFSSIHQNDDFLPDGFNLVILNVTLGHKWSAVVGTLSGTAATGTLLDSDGMTVLGSLSIMFTDAMHFSGQGQLMGVPTTISGARAF